MKKIIIRIIMMAMVTVLLLCGVQILGSALGLIANLIVELKDFVFDNGIYVVIGLILFGIISNRNKIKVR